MENAELARLLETNAAETRQQIEALAVSMERRFDAVDERFDQVDARLTRVDTHLAQVDVRLAQVDARFTQVDDRFTQIDNRFIQIDNRFTQIDNRFSQVDERSTELESRLIQRIDASAAETRAYARDSRHQFEILVEDLRHKLEFVTEHVMENSASIHRLEAKIDEGLLQHDVRITRLEAITARRP